MTCPAGYLLDCSGGKMAHNGGGAKKDGGELKIVIIGDGGCGKTSLLMVYAKGDFPEVRRAPLKINRFKISPGVSVPIK